MEAQAPVVRTAAASRTEADPQDGGCTVNLGVRPKICQPAVTGYLCESNGEREELDALNAIRGSQAGRVLFHYRSLVTESRFMALNNPKKRFAL